MAARGGVDGVHRSVGALLRRVGDLPLLFDGVEAGSRSGRRARVRLGQKEVGGVRGDAEEEHRLHRWRNVPTGLPREAKATRQDGLLPRHHPLRSRQRAPRRAATLDRGAGRVEQEELPRHCRQQDHAAGGGVEDRRRPPADGTRRDLYRAHDGSIGWCRRRRGGRRWGERRRRGGGGARVDRRLGSLVLPHHALPRPPDQGPPHPRTSPRISLPTSPGTPHIIRTRRGTLLRPAEGRRRSRRRRLRSARRAAASGRPAPSSAWGAGARRRRTARRPRRPGS